MFDKVIIENKLPSKYGKEYTGGTTDTAEVVINDTEISTNVLSLPYTTDEPTEDNTEGLKIVVLSQEPATKYDGYLYIITA